MTKKPLFPGLVFDENDLPADTAYVGEDPCYVVDDAGFRRHIPSEQVDRQVLTHMQELIKGSEDLVSAQAAKMLGQDDVFSVAAIANQLKNMDKQFDAMLQTGLPEDARAYLGMLGFKIVINVHGEVVRVDQPGAASDDDHDGEE
jgi:hypothetical protein